MTNERTQAYGRVVQTLDEIGATKLLPAEQARIRDAADTLIFASDLDEARDALRDIGVARRAPARQRPLARGARRHARREPPRLRAVQRPRRRLNPT